MVMKRMLGRFMDFATFSKRPGFRSKTLRKFVSNPVPVGMLVDKKGGCLNRKANRKAKIYFYFSIPVESPSPNRQLLGGAGFVEDTKFVPVAMLTGSRPGLAPEKRIPC
ncbi:hypothetical protein [Cupriavidus sp. BIC8F]|uniref:hypothetical protein n=1 Tax=Cupriavidus sp. BIC8F TaxID=3079014 RepID=UPI0029170C9D|nr:hypothetical protein [Cupriavidus sp. BIC8F]